MNNQIRINKATVFDIDNIINLAKQNEFLEIHTPYTYWVVCSFFGDYTYTVSVNGNIAGYILCVANQTDVLIWQIGILSSYRRNGLAKLLLDTVYNIATQQNKTLQCTIAKENQASLSLFEKFCLEHHLHLIALGDVYPESAAEVPEKIYKMMPICDSSL